MANIAIPDKPSFKVEMEETTEGTPGSYEEFNPRFKRFLENDACLKDAISKCEKTAVLPAGHTSITFHFDEGVIGENSKINLESSSSELRHNGITAEGGSVTVAFSPQEENVHVKVVVTDVLV